MTTLWQSFFHAPVDLAALALFRILIGLVILASAVSYARSAPLLLDPDGMLPFRLWQRGPDRRFFSVLRWLPDSSGSVRLVIALYGIAGAALSLGLTTPWAATVAFVTGMSLHHRNRYVLHSGDALLRMLTFLLIFADSGQVWSIDAILSPTRASAGSPWALRLMQLQIAAIYLQSVWFKLKGRTWRRGTASHYATRLLAHRRRRLPAWADTAGAHRVATYGTLVVETAGGVLVWFETTWFVGIAGVGGLHLALQLLMRMHVFQWTMLASLVLFVPGELLSGLFAAS